MQCGWFAYANQPRNICGRWEDSFSRHKSGAVREGDRYPLRHSAVFRRGRTVLPGIFTVFPYCGGSCAADP